MAERNISQACSPPRANQSETAAKEQTNSVEQLRLPANPRPALPEAPKGGAYQLPSGPEARGHVLRDLLNRVRSAKAAASRLAQPSGELAAQLNEEARLLSSTPPPQADAAAGAAPEDNFSRAADNLRSISATLAKHTAD